MRILIVDDHPVTRDGLRSALASSTEVEIVGEASNGEEAVDAVERFTPDVVFMDVRMPGMGGIEATRIIRESSPHTRVILFTVDESRSAIHEAIAAGVSGYLLKDASGEELVNAAQLALEGKAVIHPQLTRAFLEEVQAGDSKAETTASLSKREREILKMLAEGRSVKEIASGFELSVKTVEAHKFNLMRKLDIHNKAQLVQYAIQKKVIRLPETVFN